MKSPETPDRIAMPISRKYPDFPLNYGRELNKNNCHRLCGKILVDQPSINSGGQYATR
jgi:hypothetical protein